MIDDGVQLAGLASLAVAAAGIVYQAIAAVFVGRLRQRAVAPREGPAVTILKPLHGAEPHLVANLAGFLVQDYAAPIQIVFGVHAADDPAIAVVERLRVDHPLVDLSLVVDDARHGSNGKVSNLVNMMAAARHDVLVVSDSDIAVAPNYLARVVAGLGADGVGAVTCLYHGRGDAGGWSRLAAQGISYGFLPAVMVGLRLRLAQPCMGSTIALRRGTLEAIGGFAAFADLLADDHAIGVAVRVPGLRVAVPPLSVAHGCDETTFGDLVRHELRWNVTVRQLDPWGYLGFGFANPLPSALAATVFEPRLWPIIIASLVVRRLVAVLVDRATETRTGPIWWLPARDLLTFGLFLAGFVVQSVDWRGARLKVARDGLIVD